METVPRGSDDCLTLDVTEGSERLLDEVRAWLAKGGYVLELEAAQVLARMGAAFVEQAYHFEDPITELDREGDIRAFYLIDPDQDSPHGVAVAAECKDTTAPWVFFVGGESADERIMRHGTDCANCPRCWALEARLYRSMSSYPNAYAVTEKRANNAKDHAHGAVQQAASALVAEYADGTDDGHKDQVFASFGYAIVVTRSPLVVCALDRDGGLHLTKTNAANVTVPRLDLPDGDFGYGIAVTVVHLDSLADVLAPLLAPFDVLELEDAAAAVRSSPSRTERPDASS